MVNPQDIISASRFTSAPTSPVQVSFSSMKVPNWPSAGSLVFRVKLSSLGEIHQNCLTLLCGNCLVSWAAKYCSDSPLCLVDERQDLTVPIFGIHQSLCCNCQKVCWQRIYFISELLRQVSKRCINNCFTLVNSPLLRWKTMSCAEPLLPTTLPFLS
jgi:hypothetical protein